MTEDPIEIRPARTSDAQALAVLINMAGEGIPAFLWSQSAPSPEQAFAVGTERAARDTGSFSFTNAHVVQRGESVVAMLLGYRLPDPYEVGELSALPEVVRPLVELEALAPGSWYINAVAALDEERGRGFGSKLMQLARELAKQSGAKTLSLIVSRENEGAVRLYERLGYRPVATRRALPYLGSQSGEEWVLMTRRVDD